VQEASSERGDFTCPVNEKLVANLLFNVASIVIAFSTFHHSSLFEINYPLLTDGEIELCRTSIFQLY